VDQIVVFQVLTIDEIKEIVGLELDKIQKRLSDQNIGLEATPKAIEFLTKEGYSAEFGARNLRRTVQLTVEDALSEGILSSRFVAGDAVVVDEQDDEIVLNVKDHKPEPPLLEAVTNAEI
jgi:ATP-dependent Clp protease ATP-binding subunit ClpA